MIEKNTLDTPKRGRKKLDLRPLIAFVSVFISLIAIFFSTGVSPFGARSVLVSDLSAQYAPYLVTMRNKIFSASSLGYSFEIGMGKNLLGILAYYAASPLNLLTLLFPASKISDAIVLLIMLKLSFSGAFMTWLLDCKFKSETKMSILFGMIYALCSFSMSFIFNFIWLDGFALLPLLILCVEKILEDTKNAWKLFPVLIFLFVSNYYIAYMVGIFSFFYLLGRIEYIKNVSKEEDRPSAGKTVGVFLLVAICAAMVCAFLLVPAGLDTIRNGDNSSQFKMTMDPGFPAVKLISQLFLGKLTDITTNLPFIYSSLLVLILLLLFFRNPKIGKALKIRAGAALFCGAVSFLMPVINQAWHLFNDPNWFLYRYSFLFIFGTILIAFYSFLHLKDLRNKDFLITSGILFLLLLIAEHFGGAGEGESMFFQNLLVMMLLMICLFGMTKEKWPESLSNIKRWGSGILVPIVVVEIVFLAPKVTVGAIFNDTQEAESFSAEVSELKKLTSEIGLNGNYRLEQDGILSENIDSLSLSSYTDTKGIGAFCSMSNKTQQRFLKQLGYCTNFNYTSAEHRNVILPADSLLGIRYVISGKSEISGLKYMGSCGRYSIFENPYALQMAFLAEPDAPDFDGYALEKAGKGKDYFTFQEKWMSSLSGIDADDVFTTTPVEWEIQNAENYTGQTDDLILEYDEERDGLDLENVESGMKEVDLYLRTNAKSPIILRGTFTLEKDSPVYLSIPFLMHSAPLTVYCNGKRIYFEESTSYYSVILDTGVHKAGETITIEVRCDDDMFASFTPLIAVLDTDALKKQTESLGNGISGLSVSDGKVTFTASSDSARTLIATIPYEKGWKAYVDGKAVEISSYQDAFLCLHLESGSHEVELKFTPPGVSIGVIISATGVILSIGVVLFTRKNKKENGLNEGEKV